MGSIAKTVRSAAPTKHEMLAVSRTPIGRALPVATVATKARLGPCQTMYAANNADRPQAAATNRWQLEGACKTMNLEQISASMDKFEQQFERALPRGCHVEQGTLAGFTTRSTASIGPARGVGYVGSMRVVCARWSVLTLPRGSVKVCGERHVDVDCTELQSR